MKILKWLLYIVLVLVALVLIVPLFMPSTTNIKAEQLVSVTPEQVFINAARYTDRDKWDPWLEMEPDAEMTITPNPDYVGSTYTWKGKKLNTGKMVVDSVAFGKYIAASIYFGKDPKPSLVEWKLEPAAEGTKINWSFTSEGAWPLERLWLNLFKGVMLSDFKHGLSNYKDYLDENPPALSVLGPIEPSVLPAMNAIVIEASGTMDQFGEQMAELFPRLAAEQEAKGLEMAGPPFSHYLSYDEETGVAQYLVGIPITGKAKNSGDIKFKSYKEMPVIQAVHTGPYEGLHQSYGKLMEYVEDNAIDLKMEAFEIYLTDPMAEPDVTRWQTLIAMPLK